MTTRVEAWSVDGIAEITPDDDLAEVIAEAVDADGRALADGDIVVVTSKIVSKAEGRAVSGDREAAIDAETVRVVARRGDTRIVQTRHGLVLAAAGVDESNAAPGTVLLLPDDPDASARAIRAGLARRFGLLLGVVISDTLGRPWRNGQTDAAIGTAGIVPLADLRGRSDRFGNVLEVTEMAVADEIAAAADLVKGKLENTPVAIVRGLAEFVGTEDGPGARALIRPAEADMFRYGSADVVTARRTIRKFTGAPVDPAAVRRAVAAAVTAPAPHHTTPWRFVCVESADTRRRLLDAMLAAWVADLRGDGFDEDAIARRTRRGDVLRDATYLVVPCLASDGMHPYPDQRRGVAELAMFHVAMGAGVQNFLVSLAVEGLGACWVSSTMFCPKLVTDELDLPAGWRPMGAVGIGHPAAAPPDRLPRDAADFVVVR